MVIPQDDPGRLLLGGHREPCARGAPHPGAVSAPHARPDRRLARRELADALLALARSNRSLQDAALPADLAAAFLRGYDSRRATQEAYASDLADWLVWLSDAGTDAFAATLDTVERYACAPLADGRPAAPATVARRLACISHFYRRAVYADLVDRNPVVQARRPNVPERVATLGISAGRAQTLIGAAREAGPRATLLVLLLLELGLRVSEAVGADIEDLGEQGRHRVLAIRGKGQATKATPVPLNPALVAAVADAAGGRDGGALLVTRTGRRLTRQHAGKIIKALGTGIGLPDLHPHELRHAFVTIALDEGASLRDVQDAARHADPRTTRGYDRNRGRLERHPTHHLASVFEP
ncbi:MAG: tyrosine-type recombinase/integrase [Solirubrobacteraceae bacterium]